MQKYQDSSLSPEERASDLLARMNLAEKFGQIQCYNAIDSFLGKSVEKQNPYGVGQVCILIATYKAAETNHGVRQTSYPRNFPYRDINGCDGDSGDFFSLRAGAGFHMGPGAAAENGSLHCPTGTRYGNQSCAGSCVRYLP